MGVGMKKIVVGAAIVIAFVAVAYIGSPYLAVHNFVATARSGDVDQLESAVDFPRVRESVKSQLNASIAARMQSDPAMRGNPFAGLGMLLAPALVDRMVDTVVTADGIAAMTKAGGPQGTEKAENVAENPDLEFKSGYLTVDRFRTKIAMRDKPGDSLSLIFERQGMFGWRLVRIELPTSALHDLPNATAKPSDDATTLPADEAPPSPEDDKETGSAVASPVRNDLSRLRQLPYGDRAGRSGQESDPCRGFDYEQCDWIRGELGSSREPEYCGDAFQKQQGGISAAERRVCSVRAGRM